MPYFNNVFYDNVKIWRAYAEPMPVEVESIIALLILFIFVSRAGDRPESYLESQSRSYEQQRRLISTIHYFQLISVNLIFAQAIIKNLIKIISKSIQTSLKWNKFCFQTILNWFDFLLFRK